MLKEILRENFGKLTFIYAIILVEFALFASVPYMTGLAIDELIAGRMGTLYLYGFILLLSLVIGGARRLYDTRVFGRIYTKRAKAIIDALRQSGLDQKRIISRYGLVGIYSDFFEYQLPSIMNVAVGMVVSVGMIAYLQPWLCVFVLPGIGCHLYFHSLTAALTQKREYELQHSREDISHALADGKECGSLLDNQMVTLIKKSDLESAGWSFADLISIVVELGCLLIVTKTGLTPGEIASVLLYLSSCMAKSQLAYSFFHMMKLMQMTDDLLLPSEQGKEDELN